MKYKPIAVSQESIVAGAELDAKSAFDFMSLIEEKKTVEKRLQKRRENAFFNDGFAMDISTDDVDTSDISLSERHLKEIDMHNNSIWVDVIEDCYCYRNSRDPNHPLDRISSVSENIDLPSINTRSISFDIENAEVKTINGQEAVEIRHNDDVSLILYIDTDDIVFIQGIYYPPLTKDLETLENQIKDFDKVTIRNNHEDFLNILNAMPLKSIERDMSKTEVLFSNDFSTKVYLPKSQVVDEKERESPKLIRDIKRLRELPSLPNKTSKKELLETLEKGYVLSDKSIKLCEVIDEGKKLGIQYSHLAKPKYIEQVSRITGMGIVSIPQESTLAFVDKNVPEWITRLDDKFPEKNNLTEEEKEELHSYLDTPSFLRTNQNLTSESKKSKEILLQMFENNDITQEEIVSFYLAPWNEILPTENAVKSAIEYGENIRRKLELLDSKYGTELYDSIVPRKQRKVYNEKKFSN